MTWPGAALIVGGVGLMIAYMLTSNPIVGAAAWIAFIGYLAWRMIPQRAQSCDAPPGAVPHKNATD